MNLCKRIAEYVRENNISQKKLCERSGITENALSLVLNGKRRLEAGEYIAICNALCVPYDRFVDTDTEMGGRIA